MQSLIVLLFVFRVCALYDYNKYITTSFSLPWVLVLGLTVSTRPLHNIGVTKYLSTRTNSLVEAGVNPSRQLLFRVHAVYIKATLVTQVGHLYELEVISLMVFIDLDKYPCNPGYRCALSVFVFGWDGEVLAVETEIPTGNDLGRVNGRSEGTSQGRRSKQERPLSKRLSIIMPGVILR